MSEPDWVLLERVAIGQGSAADRATVDEWIGSDAEHRRLFEQIARIADGTRQLRSEPRFDGAASLARVRRRRRRPSDTGWSLTAIAAALILAIGLGVTFVVRSPPRATPRTFATSRGQRATFRLDDGTRVVLAPASHLRVDGRSATLDGEAFFTVVHNAQAPFVVHAGRTTTTDIGTRFDVRAYPEDSSVRVAVEEGRVAVNTIALAHGEVATIPRTGTTQIDRGVENIGAWTTGRLEWHNTPALEAVRALTRWYDLDLRLGDSTLAAVPLTASFRDEPVDEVLHIVAVTLGARVHWTGRTVILYRRSQEH